MTRPVTIQDAVELVGKTGSILLDGLVIDVKVNSVKQSYGKLRWLVTPIAGAGSKWVETVKVE